MMSVVWLTFVALALAVAVSDLIWYRIPNWVGLALCVLFAGIALTHGTDGTWPEHLGAAALCLTAGFAFFALKQMGAGDAKFLAALALFSGFSAMIPLLFWTAVAALFELAVILVVRRIVIWAQARFPDARDRQVPRVFVKKQAVPLGAAIALGAVIASHWFPSWLWFA